MQTIQLTAKLVKVAFTMDPDEFRAILDVDSTGMKAVPITIISSGGKKLTAHLNAKTFRKAQAAFREAGNPVVNISGNLNGGVVESAGIQIFDKQKPVVTET